VILSKDPVFDQPSSPSVDEAWDSLLPTPDGFISINGPHHEDYDQTKATSDGRELVGLTWSHQYHCLVHFTLLAITLADSFTQNMIRKEFWKLLRNESSMVGMEHSPDKNDHEMLYHEVHCFEYLRQTLMCNMDVTIEYPAVDSNTGEAKGFINGWDVAHTCKKKVKPSFKW
jgi:hypothetical protein